MSQYVVQGQTALRRGWTTGTCAAAAAQTAALLLLRGKIADSLRLQTPAGVELLLATEEVHWEGNAAVCAVRKDAGDDPDVTNGIRIFARVEKIGQGIQIQGGAGVGKVTRPGLACGVGEWAINPGPRAQIKAALMYEAREADYDGGLLVTISAENGREIAKQTYNEHLGIKGGISILGTSGIVEPMSERALTDTIHLELDSLFAQGQRVAFLCPGNYGEDFARQALALDLKKAVKCSNFIGDTLDYAVYRGYPEILLVGHAGKLIKLAAGVMNTHSSAADARQEVFTAHAALCGAPMEALEALMQAVSVDACIRILDDIDLRVEVMQKINQAVRKRLEYRLRGKARIEYVMFTNQHGLLACSPGAYALCNKLKE